MFFRFESPWFFLLLLLLPSLVLLKVIPSLGQWSRPASIRYSNHELIKHLPHGWRTTGQIILSAFRLIGIAFIIIALARPQTGQAREIIKGEGIDITLALDISGSMASLDFTPKDRLEAAKQVIADFIQKRPYDRIGLIVFASSAYHQSPPTIDHGVLSNLLEQVRLATDLGIGDRTALGIGLANAANMLKNSKAKSKVIIILTDGVNNTGEIDPLTAAEAARILQIKVYTIGMGKTGKVPVPVQDAFGQRSIAYRESEIDEETLKTIAQKTKGLYFRAEDTIGLQKIYDDINQLEKSQVEITRFERYHELAIWVLIPAILFFILEMILKQTLFRRLP